MEICAFDHWDRFTHEGYTFLELPRNTGTYTMKAKAWAPDESLYSGIYNFFLGGSVLANNIHELPQTYRMNLSSSGRVRKYF